ncbi:MAG: hypothetical protein ACOC22_00995 [bacterium]
MSTNDYLERLKNQLNDYQSKEKKDPKGNRKSKEEILSKYFVPRNEKEIFRIIEQKNGKIFQDAYFHVVSLNGSGGKKHHGKVLYCPARNEPFITKKDEKGNVVKDQDGKDVLVPVRCPLCEKAKKILKKQNPSLKGKKKDELTDSEMIIWEKNREIFIEAMKWEAKKFHIVKGIDRGKTKDGVKFWRFKKNHKNQGVLDKLLPAINNYIESFNASPCDPIKGCDFTITMVEDVFNNKPFMNLTSIIARKPSKLHDDEHVAKQWLNDPITWRTVFKPKSAPNITPIEYLEMVVNGSDPYWDETDSKNKRWIFPGRPDLEEKANQRFINLDADEDYDNFEQASDINGTEVTTASNVNKTVTAVDATNLNDLSDSDDDKEDEDDNQNSEENSDNLSDEDLDSGDDDNNSESSDDEDSDDEDSDYVDLPF